MWRRLIRKELLLKRALSNVHLPDRALTEAINRAAESESEPESESVGVGVDKIYRLRPIPGKLLFPIQRNRHADYL